MSIRHQAFFFFFSSRRRHTRCYRDWSSDVCSSDLDDPQRGELHFRPFRQAAAQLDEGPLRVEVARVLGKDRDDELVGGVATARPRRDAVHLAQAAQDEREQSGAPTLERPRLTLAALATPAEAHGGATLRARRSAAALTAAAPPTIAAVTPPATSDTATTFSTSPAAVSRPPLSIDPA